MFPEIEYDRIDSTRGMDITIVTSARTNAEGKALLDAFGFPFKTGADAVAPSNKKSNARGRQFAAKKK